MDFISQSRITNTTHPRTNTTPFYPCQRAQLFSGSSNPFGFLNQLRKTAFVIVSSDIWFVFFDVVLIIASFPFAVLLKIIMS
ncbi:hypothetical protein M434DRAFT_229467 [Hypoxylon sp. CO27-5]|nr:hypothetical protein M434DRAFT_229467 [Hypoxylon sp. CO27-5]